MSLDEVSVPRSIDIHCMALPPAWSEEGLLCTKPYTCSVAPPTFPAAKMKCLNSYKSDPRKPGLAVAKALASIFWKEFQLSSLH
uniref:Uncharacterized protein n=1 Tax=Onchocerca volvulus TaxID=6282 RepID=A0A8R1TWE9_ONCVO